MRKRILSLLLALIMLFSVSPLALAVEAEEEAGIEEVETVEPAAPAEEDAAPDAEEAPAEPAPEEEPEEPAPEEEEPAPEGEEPAPEEEEPAPEEEEPAPEEEEIGEAELEEELTEEEEETEEEESPYPGMPEGYVLTDAEYAEKQSLVAHGVAETLAGLTEGVNYESGKILFTAETEAHAQEIALAYGAELQSWSYGTASAVLSSLTVAEAVAIAVDLENNMPAVNPNYIHHLTPATEPKQMLGKADGQRLFTYGWEDWVRYLFTNPDPYISNPDSWDYQWQHDVMHTYAAWNVTMGQDFVTVAVIDTGLNESYGEIYNYKTYDIGLGTHDGNGHGTAVASLIAGTADNGQFGAGLAPNVTIMSIKAIDDDGWYDDGDMCNAIERAINCGAWIINISAGGYYYNSTMESVIRKAVNYGVTVIAAAGSEGSNMLKYPAAYDGVIAVGSVNRAGTRARHSNYGDYVDVSAPGVDIFTCGTEYGGVGTSYAAPLVTGAAALYMSAMYDRVDSYTMEKKLKSSLTGGFIDLDKMFAGDTTAPWITAYDEFDNEIVGSTVSVTVDGYFEVFAPGTNDYAMIVTFDGKTPAVKAGEIVNGSYYGSYKNYFYLSDLGAEPGTTLTVKAACLSGLGVLGKVATMKIKVLPSAHPTSVSITDPGSVRAGSTVTLSAVVYPENADQSVTWSLINPNGTGATLTPAGKLTTKAGVGGTVVVEAHSTVDPSRYHLIGIHVDTYSPVYKVVLDRTSFTLRAYPWYSGASVWKINPTFFDKEGNDLGDFSGYYRFTSSNPKVATVKEDGTVKAVGKGSATITCQALDGSGKKATCKVTVAEGVYDLTLSGQLSVAPGASATIKAKTEPASFTGKKVTWRIDPAVEGVTVSASGVVKVAKTVPVGTSITVYADVTDTCETQSRSWNMTVQPKATAVTIWNSWLEWGCLDQYLKYNSRGSLTNMTLFSHDVRMGDYEYNTDYASLSADTEGNSVPVVWSSSNTNVAVVDDCGGVYAVAPGTCKITAKTQDGSGKSATVTVKVINPVSSVSVVSKGVGVDDGVTLIDFGKSVGNTAVLGTAYGKPGVTKVRWEYNAYTLEYDEYEDCYYVNDLPNEYLNSKYISINSSGTLTVKAALENYWITLPGDIYIDVWAYATDGTWQCGWTTYIVQNLTSKVIISDQPKDEYGNWPPPIKSDTIDSFEAEKPYYIHSNGYYEDCTVKSSNPKVAGAMISWDSEGNQMFHVIPGTKTGKAVITVTAADGSGKKATLTVTVK